MAYFFSVAKEFCKQNGYGYLKSTETELTFTMPDFNEPFNLKWFELVEMYMKEEKRKDEILR